MRFAAVAAFALCLLLTAAPASALDGVGGFTPTGSMGTNRQEAGAAPLADGRVLVAGGDDGGGGLQTAEIFNPATGSFTSTGSLTTQRRYPAVAPLPDGGVLVAGGLPAGPGTLASAEKFDPTTGMFTALANSMGTARAGAAAVPLGDGTVLIAGGFNTTTGDLNTAEIFHPATNTFTPVAATLPAVRAGAAGAPLSDGRGLIAGGESVGTVLTSTLIFDPASGMFTAGPSLGTARYEPGAAALGGGLVLVAGGYTDASASGPLASAEVYDEATNSFSSAGIEAMSTARGGPVAAPLSANHALVAGGGNGTGNTAFKTAETFTFIPAGGGGTTPPGGGAGTTPPTAGPTGLRAHALKQCKKRAKKKDWSKKRLRKCKKKARKLPL